uniref:Uncharacterized protein n=1 Tax=Arundo donax TaxID=35708 RepID=A0A0A9F5H1_ARUDO
MIAPSSWSSMRRASQGKV